MASRVNRNLARVGRVALVATALAFISRAEAGGPYVFYSLTPCRVVDTRLVGGPTGTIPATGTPSLAANTNRSFPILGNCSVPTDAQAVVFNVTIARAKDMGDIRIYPANTSMPFASTINWALGESALANGAIVPVADDGSGNHIGIRVDMPPGSTGTVDLILDVTGYFK